MKPRRHVFVCVNERQESDPLPCCAGRGGREVYESLRSAVARAGLTREVWVTRTGCMVHCNTGVTVVVYPDDCWYGHVSLADVPELVAEHLLGGRPVQRLLRPGM
jgi:(2Fe-2S) ferredoxin